MRTYDMLFCPKCRMPLRESGKALRCESGHSFDIAASGYVNLLLSGKAGDATGDSKEMIAARGAFLEAGYYGALRKAAVKAVREIAPGPAFRLLDAGCGEGYYTRGLAKAFPEAFLLGADISKSGSLAAAKRDQESLYITASAAALPVTDGWADFVLSAFAPAFDGEFRRVLAPEGRVLMIAPGRDHLIELKEAVYDKAYRNREEKHGLDGFKLTDSRRISYRVHIPSTEHIRRLFSMTPYAHRTSQEGLARLEKLTAMEVTADFLLLIFR